MHLGRERPLPAEAWGRDRGVAEGVAHAPLADDGDADIGTDKDAGGIERRPVTSREVQRPQ
jgi:hypothetical protein